MHHTTWRILRYVMVLMIIGALVVSRSADAAEHDYIRISDPFLRKVPVAIPLFKALEGTPDNPSLSEQSAQTMIQTLDFTGYFNILPQESYLVDYRNFEVEIDKINFSSWTAIGAELLITGGFSVQNEDLTMDLRLIDPYKAKLLLGKRFKGKLKDQRRIIRRFCSDLIYHLTGHRGIFDSKIAFLSTGTGSKEIYICEFDGANPQKITQTNSINLSPSWSSDGKWIAYTSYARGKPDIYIRHLKEKRGTVIAKKGINIDPEWLPNQFALGATLSFSGDPEIYLLTGTGKVIKRLTNSWGIDVSPTWSPDGKQMAFVSNRSGTPQIYIQNMDSGQAERLTFEGRYNTSPRWSPRGDRIVYSGMEKGQFNIYTITVDGQQIVQLTRQTGNNESPSWAPDGSLIAFSSTREGVARIYVMTAYGTDQRRLLILPGEQTGPAWSPSVLNN